jgi:hypothetical protein
MTDDPSAAPWRVSIVRVGEDRVIRLHVGNFTTVLPTLEAHKLGSTLHAASGIDTAEGGTDSTEGAPHESDGDERTFTHGAPDPPNGGPAPPSTPAPQLGSDIETADIGGTATCPDCGNPLRFCDCPDREPESWDAAAGEKP